MSAHGHTFHRTEHCMALSRATHIYSADRAQAEAHQLHACGICYRKAGSAAGKKSKGGPAWATEVTPQNTGKGQ
jgi:hypothetical protein